LKKKKRKRRGFEKSTKEAEGEKGERQLFLKRGEREGLGRNEIGERKKHGRGEKEEKRKRGKREKICHTRDPDASSSRLTFVL